MDKFFNSTFDALSNVVPGILFILSLLLLNTSMHTLDDFLELINKVNFGSGAFIVFGGYVIGFAITPIGKRLYQTIGYKIWGQPDGSLTNMTLSEKYSIIREFSPSNFKYVESWNMFCTLSHNLAVASIMIILTGMVRQVIFGSFSLGMTCVSIFCLFLTGVFINRAVTFRKWAVSDLDAAILRLDLLSNLQAPPPKRFEISLKSNKDVNLI